MTLPVEVIRIALMVALGVIAYLMIRQWNEDYGRAQAPDAQAPPPIVTQQGDATPPLEEPVGPADIIAPEVSPGLRDETPSDVPGSEFAGESIADVPSVPSQAASGRLVHVVTPALELWIDRLGGDIVGLQLPKYPQTIDGDASVRLLDRRRGHTFVAQSGLIGRDGTDKGGSRPVYLSNSSEYRIEEGELRVELRHQAEGGIEVVKRFVLEANDYYVAIEHEVVNRSGGEFRGNVFAQLKRDRWVPEAAGFSMGPRPYLGAAFTMPDSRYEKVDFDDLDEETYRFELQGGWVAMLQHYFVVAWVGERDVVNRYNGRRLGDGNYAVGYVAPEFSVAPGATGTVRAGFYAGPKDQERLKAIADHLNLTVDYGILWWLAIPLFTALVWIYAGVGNWGVAIILLTLVIKLILYPLSAASYRSMAKMRKVTPQLKRLQERHAGDRQKLSQEMMALYKREGANPLGGCLPMLLQMPVFFALYWVLYESVELRQAPFFFWITDLSAMDPYFILPILMGGSMYLTTMLNPPMPDPMQAKMMKFMPVMFTVLFLFFPSGLVLYWLVNNLLSVLQQWYITRRVEAGG